MAIQIGPVRLCQLGKLPVMLGVHLDVLGVPLPVVEGARDDAADRVDDVRAEREETADLPGQAHRPLPGQSPCHPR
jgi:hypothetical protein